MSEPPNSVAADRAKAELKEPGAARGIQVAAAYTVANALPRAFSFLLLPLMTQVVSPAEYGHLSVAVAIASVVTLVLGLGADVAIQRNYFQLADDHELRERYINSVWVTLMAAPLIALCGSAILTFVFGTPGALTPTRLVLAAVSGGMLTAATAVPLSVLRSSQRIRPYLAIGVGNALITSTAVVGAVVLLRWGVTGWLAAMVIANTCTLLIAVRAVPLRRPKPYDATLVRSAFRFGLPMVPHSVAHWALQLADRLVLATLVSAGALGIYSLAANFAVPLMVLVLSISQAFSPVYARAGRPGHGTAALASTIVTQASAVAFLTTSAALLTPPLLLLVTPDSYAAAAGLTGWFIAGYGFLGLYGIAMALASLTMGATQGVWRVTVTTALLNVALVYGLTGPLGLNGAAAASTAAYAFLFLGMSRYAYLKGARVSLDWRRLATVAGVCVATVLIGVLATSASSTLGAAARVLLLAVAGLALALTDERARKRLLDVPLRRHLPSRH